MEKYVIDTNFFFNLQIKSGFGESPKEIIVGFTKIARALSMAQKAQFFMPPRIVEELYTFIDSSEPYIVDFMTAVTVKSPESNGVQFSASVFYKLVEDIRDRSYRGMKVAEEIIDEAARTMMTKGEMTGQDYQKQVGDFVTRLRSRYRQATRVKFLDSVADLDLIVLARELEATLVSSDEGVLLWGREFGVKEIEPKLLKAQLESVLAQ